LAEHWAELAREVQVLVQPARQLSFDGRHRSFLRLGYPRLNPAELKVAVERLCQAYPR
jgi:DNA-binding transcriptional MocR family regulator